MTNRQKGLEEAWSRLYWWRLGCERLGMLQV